MTALKEFKFSLPYDIKYNGNLMDLWLKLVVITYTVHLDHWLTSYVRDWKTCVGI